MTDLSYFHAPSKGDKLEQIVKQFIDKNNISCAETIYQCDWVLENSQELIEKLCNIVGYKKYED